MVTAHAEGFVFGVRGLASHPPTSALQLLPGKSSYQNFPDSILDQKRYKMTTKPLFLTVSRTNLRPPVARFITWSQQIGLLRLETQRFKMSTYSTAWGRKSGIRSAEMQQRTLPTTGILNSDMDSTIDRYQLIPKKVNSEWCSAGDA